MEVGGVQLDEWVWPGPMVGNLVDSVLDDACRDWPTGYQPVGVQLG